MVEVITFGCRINAYESEVLKEKLAALDNLVIINTCAVTGEAERQCRQAIRKLRREKPNVRIIVTGCAAQIAPQKFAAMPEVDLVLGNKEKAEIEKYDPSCGVAVCTDYDHTEKNLTVTVSVKSNIQQRCRLVIFLVEDGIVAEQTGDRDYVHNNVVRSVLTSGVYGDYFNDRLPLYPGMEYSISKSAVLDKGWNDGNMRVVAAVLVPTEDGASFRGDNVNACDLAGGKADYETSE